jgi:hypothetical protein
MRADMVTLEANLVLDHVRWYLGKHSYSKDGAFLSFQGYLAMMIDASQILNDAQASVNEVDDDINAIKSMMFKVLVASVEDENVQAILPFQTSLREGNTFTHIVNESFYDVQTNYHSIEQGDAICGRGGSFDESARFRLYADIRRKTVPQVKNKIAYNTPQYNAPQYIDQHTVPTCPGCLAKAKRIVVKHLLAKCDGDLVRVAKMLAVRQ